MASIDLKNVSVDFPIYNTSGRSLKKRIIEVATGGKIGADPGGRVVVRALDDVCLSLHDGDRVALIGSNGSGKSTLLRTLSGVYTPTLGNIQIAGRVTSLIDISLGIDPEATGRENIFVRGRLLGMSKVQILNHLDEIIEFTGLGSFIDMPMRTYSTGMGMRLAFSVSTMIRPEILVMDEWLSVGDEGFRRRAGVRMRELIQSTNILIVATHSREQANHANRVVWLASGKVVMDGPPQQVCEAYFGGDNQSA